MSRPLFAHIAALRHQVKRIRRATVFSIALLLPGAALLLTTTANTLLALALVAALGGYLLCKVRRTLWTYRIVNQLRLEEQFVRHSPSREHIQTCLRRFDHLWTNSLTLKGLRALMEHPPLPKQQRDAFQEIAHRHFSRALSSLRPSPVPFGLLWLASLSLLWVGFSSSSLLEDTALPAFLALTLLLVLLLNEVTQEILCADLRDGFSHWATLLSTWTQALALDELIAAQHEKPYRHTPLYRSWVLGKRPDEPHSDEPDPVPA